MKKPNFFIVGAPKCGTTSWHHYLGQHPDIFMSEPKEPRFFCRDLYNEGRPGFYSYQDRAKYLKLFESANHEKIAGESSPQYMYSKVAAKEISKFDPQAKILICLRNPVDYIHSLYIQMRVSGHEPIKSLEKALEAEEERMKNKDKNHPHVFLFYKDSARFAEQVGRFLQQFPKDQVKILLMRDFRNNVEIVYKEVLEFLEVDTTFRPDFTVHNMAKKVCFPRLRKFLQARDSKLKNLLKKILPVCIYRKPHLCLSKLTAKEATKGRMSVETEKTLQQEFQSEVEKLGKIMGRDLISLWKYKSE